MHHRWKALESEGALVWFPRPLREFSGPGVRFNKGSLLKLFVRGGGGGEQQGGFLQERKGDNQFDVNTCAGEMRSSR